jgi:protocatechuate 3,4-dioxygenase alpha subunit
VTLPQTPSQTVGPFFAIGLYRPGDEVVATDDRAGTRIRLEGRVLDAERNPIDDALVEIWQANGHGRYRHPADDRDLPLVDGFGGFGRCATDPDGWYRFDTVKPGPVPDPEGELQAPHISMAVLARGLLSHVYTRVYFEDEDNSDDWALRRVPPGRRPTLIARLTAREPVPTYRMDIRFQGEDETVFFDF